jgi:hypothetical protein
MSDNRQITRDSLFIMAELRCDGHQDEYRVKVRNLSAGGLMAEGQVKVGRGDVVWVNLRHAGWVEGSVAWVQDSRFGVAFREEVDSRSVRAPLPAPELPDGMIIKRRNNGPVHQVGPSRKTV